MLNVELEMKLLTFTPLSQVLTREQDRFLNTAILERMAGFIRHDVDSRKILDYVEWMESDTRYAYIWFNHPNRANWSRF